MQMINIGSSQLYETKKSLLILRLAELQAAVIAHFVHNGQAGQFVTLAAQLVAARLDELDGICDDLYVLGGGQVQGRYEHYEFQRAIREAGSAAGFPKK